MIVPFFIEIPETRKREDPYGRRKTYIIPAEEIARKLERVQSALRRCRVAFCQAPAIVNCKTMGEFLSPPGARVTTIFDRTTTPNPVTLEEIEATLEHK
jgi:hypothetical protein